MPLRPATRLSAPGVDGARPSVLRANAFVGIYQDVVRQPSGAVAPLEHALGHGSPFCSVQRPWFQEIHGAHNIPHTAVNPNTLTTLSGFADYIVMV